MRKRIEARLPRGSGRKTPCLPCGGGKSAALPAYPSARSGERASHKAVNRNNEEKMDRRYNESRRHAGSEAFLGMDMPKQFSLPLSAGQSSARDRYDIYVCLPLTLF